MILEILSEGRIFIYVFLFKENGGRILKTNAIRLYGKIRSCVTVFLARND